MTCFWDSLYSALKTEDFQAAGIPKKPRTTRDLLDVLVSRNRICDHVTVNCTFPTESQKNELYDWIREYDRSKISDGHWTGCCDPFLVLVCEVFRVAVRHFYKGALPGFDFDTVTVYSHTNFRRVVEFGANASHFFLR